MLHNITFSYFKKFISDNVSTVCEVPEEHWAKVRNTWATNSVLSAVFKRHKSKHYCFVVRYTNISMNIKNRVHINPHILAIFSGLSGEIGFNSISYPNNLNTTRRYLILSLVKTDGFNIITIDNNKQIENKI